MDDSKQKINDYFNGNFLPFYEKQLGELKPSGKEVKARCPFHDDHNPSLNINPANGRCSCKPCGFGGDIFKFYAKRNGLDGNFPAVLRAIVDEYGITTNGAKPQPTSNHKDKDRLPAERKRLVKTYDYLNLQGLLCFQKLRYDPKDFCLRRPDGQDGWIYKDAMQGVEPVLYNLPAVTKASEVFIVEGEKDADSLNALGNTATTNFDGAGKWRDSYSETLKGKSVILIPDADDPGRVHMQKVAASLHGVAASVKILELPNPDSKKGYDVSDFITGQPDADTAAERLSLMADGACEWAPPLEPKKDDCGVDITPAIAESYHLTDTGNGQRFADQHRGNVRYCYLSTKWLVWDGIRWKPDHEGMVRQLAKQTTRAIYQDAAQEPDPDKSSKIGKWAAASESSFRQEAMLKMAQSEPGIPILPEQMDTDPWLLNVRNGTIDLRTGELLHHRKSDLITKITPVDYDPDAECPQWLDFLDTVMDGDQEMTEYLCRVAGYSLTGDAGEQCLFVFHGNGENGKSTYLNVKQSILEDYALQTSFDTFTVKKNEGVRNDIARMRTVRMVVAIETGDGKRLDEQVVKQLTGGDKVAARFLHQEFFEYRPQFKVFLAANHKPTIYGQDHAIWRRIRLIPFNVKIPQEKRVNNYELVLLEERAGILNWMIHGCLEWQRIGLADPNKVKLATEKYRSEMDVLEDFIDSRVIIGDEQKTKHGNLYAAYDEWCQETKETPFKTRTFAKMLEGRGFQYSKTHHVKIWKGIGLRA